MQIVDKSTIFGGLMDSNRFLMFYQSFDTIVKAIKRMEMSYMREYGLRSVHMRCLIKIKESADGVSATELSRECGIDKALTSRILRELLEGGFIVARTHGEGKAYKKRFFLTEQSERITNDINNDIAKYIVAARGDTSEEDIKTFYRVLFTFEKNISRIDGNDKGEYYGT